MKTEGKPVTSNSFTITKRKMRSMKRATKDTDTLNNEFQKSETHAKITPRNMTSNSTNTNRTIDDNVMDSDDVSDVYDTPLTLKHYSSSDIFNNTY